MADVVTVNMRKAMVGTRLVVEMRLTGVRRLRLRLWLGTQIFSLGAWVIGHGVEVEVKEGRDTPYKSKVPKPNFD